MADLTAIITHRNDIAVRLTRLKVHKIKLLATPPSLLGLYSINQKKHIKTFKLPNPRQPQPPLKKIILKALMVTHAIKLTHNHHAPQFQTLKTLPIPFLNPLINHQDHQLER